MRNSNRRPATTLLDLPDDALITIFGLLTIKQVGQLRSLSKSFNALLYKPSFIKALLYHSIDNNDEILMVFYRAFSCKRKPFTAHQLKMPHLELPTSSLIKLPSNAPPDDATCDLIGSINGLICFFYHSVDTHVINIWNPCLSKLLPLPRSSNIPRQTYGYHVFFAFGFDPKTDDYKVVKLRFRFGPPKPDLRVTDTLVPKECLQVEVYSMKKGSWKLITGKFPSHVTRIYDDDEVRVHGHDDHVHWFGDHGELKKRQTIVAFDFGAETFSETPLPYDIRDSIQNRSIVLGFMAGNLCLMSHAREGESEVWVTNTNTKAGSWTKHRVFSEFSGFLYPFGFTFNNELLYKAYDNALALYCPVARTDKPCVISAILLEQTKVVRYVPSLVWVDPARNTLKLKMV